MDELLKSNRLHNTEYQLVKNCMGIAYKGEVRFAELLKEAGFEKVYRVDHLDYGKDKAQLLLDIDEAHQEVSVWVQTGRTYTELTRKQMEVLLVDFSCMIKQQLHPGLASICVPKRMITSELGEKVANSYGAKIVDDEAFPARDVAATTLFICEVSAYYRRLGKNLLVAIDDLYAVHGYYKEYLDNFFLSEESVVATKEEVIKLMRRVEEGEEVEVAGIGIKRFQKVTERKVRCLLKDGSKFSLRYRKNGTQLICHYVTLGDSATIANRKLQSLRLAIRQNLQIS